MTSDDREAGSRTDSGERPIRFLSFADQIRRTAATRSGAVAVACESETLRYGQLFDRACRLANALSQMGVRTGDRVATLESNRLESVEEVCAIALLGAVRVPLYLHNPVSLQLHMLRTVGATALILESPQLSKLARHLAELADLRVVVCHEAADSAGLADVADYEALLQASSPRDPLVATGPEAPAIIRFSSGTTGTPKGVMHRQLAYSETGEAMARAMEEVTPESLQIVAGPLSHVSGIFLWPMIARGAGIRVMPRFDPDRFLDHVEAGGTFSLLVPTMIKSILEQPRLELRKLGSLRRIGYGGAPLEADVLQRALDVFGPVLTQSFGQSEVCPITALPSTSHDTTGASAEREVLASVGYPVAGASVRVVDEAGKEVPAGTVGEVAAKAIWTMSEIWADPSATAARFTDDGYLLSGDMGYFHRGALYLTGRKDDMIISGGYNIWPAEIESALLAHPGVEDAAAFGVPHERWGETPVAVVTASGDEAPAPSELVAWCRARVGSVKKPSVVVVREAPLPRNASGKLLRRELRKEYDLERRNADSRE